MASLSEDFGYNAFEMFPEQLRQELDGFNEQNVQYLKEVLDSYEPGQDKLPLIAAAQLIRKLVTRKTIDAGVYPPSPCFAATALEAFAIEHRRNPSFLRQAFVIGGINAIALYTYDQLRDADSKKIKLSPKQISDYKHIQDYIGDISQNNTKYEIPLNETIFE